MLEIKNVYKTYSSKNGVTHRALENVSLKFANKGLIFILGKSGSGKSTLLNMIGGLDDYDRGDVLFNGRSFSTFKEEDFNFYRNSCVGFIFQDFNLVNSLSVFDNVALSLDLQGKKVNEKEVDEILKQMNVYSLKNRKVNELSGGQRQRVAIARALIKDPQIILADEPTGSLDSENSDSISEIIKNLSKDRLVIVVTHNKELAYQYGDRIIEIKDGFVLKDVSRKDENDTKKSASTLASSNLVIVNKNEKISDENINDLNITISEKRQDYYLVVDSNKKRVMSLYPNVKEIINDEDNKELFVPYVHNENEIKTIHPVKSNMPLRKGLKLGFANLKRKVGKLVFTIALAIISILITGVASNISQYSFYDAISMSLEKDEGQYLEVSSSFSVSNSDYTLKQEEIEFLKNTDRETALVYDNIKFQYYHEGSGYSRTKLSENVLFNSNFEGVIVSENLQTLGYKDKHLKIIFELNDISEDQKTRGIYISSIVAETILSAFVMDDADYNNIEDLLGLELQLENDSFTITKNYTFPILGIYDIDDNKPLYKEFFPLTTESGKNDEQLIEKYEEVKRLTNKVIVNPGFIDYLKSCNYCFNFETISSNYDNYRYLGQGIRRLEQFDIDNARSQIEFYTNNSAGITKENFKEKVSTLKPNQVFIGKKTFEYITGGMNYSKGTNGIMPDQIQKYNDGNKILIVTNTSELFNQPGSEVYYALQDIEILGVIGYEVGLGSSEKNYNTFYLPPSAYNEIIDIHYMPSQAFLPLDENNTGDTIKAIYDNGYRINNNFVSPFLKLNDTFAKYSTFINIVTIVWFFIVTILLYSLMSNSIKGFSKQIGVLKALGANNKDLYKVYSVEAIIIGIVSIVIGVALFFAVGNVVNNVISAKFYDFYYPLCLFDTVTILFMIISTILIILVSIIIPLSRLKNIKPIEVINSAE